jgi:hypothetical protein
MKRLIRQYMLWRWGLRGSLKPPLGPYYPTITMYPRPLPLWYRWRYWCWELEKKAYHWTGLPNEWWHRVYPTYVTNPYPPDRREFIQNRVR